VLDAVLFPLPRCGLPRVWEDSPWSLNLIGEIFFFFFCGVFSWKSSFSVITMLSLIDVASSK